MRLISGEGAGALGQGELDDLTFQDDTAAPPTRPDRAAVTSRSLDATYCRLRAHLPQRPLLEVEGSRGLGWVGLHHDVPAEAGPKLRRPKAASRAFVSSSISLSRDQRRGRDGSRFRTSAWPMSTPRVRVSSKTCDLRTAKGYSYCVFPHSSLHQSHARTSPMIGYLSFSLRLVAQIRADDRGVWAAASARRCSGSRNERPSHGMPPSRERQEGIRTGDLVGRTVARSATVAMPFGMSSSPARRHGADPDHCRRAAPAGLHFVGEEDAQ